MQGEFTLQNFSSNWILHILSLDNSLDLLHNPSCHGNRLFAGFRSHFQGTRCQSPHHARVTHLSSNTGCSQQPAIENQLATNKCIERNNLTGWVFIFCPPFKMIHWVMWPLKLIQLYLISPIEVWRRTLDLFFSLGVFLLQKWRDCLESMLPGWQIDILACSFSWDPLSIEKASPLKLSVRLLSFQCIMCFPLLCGTLIQFRSSSAPWQAAAKTKTM